MICKFVEEIALPFWSSWVRALFIILLRAAIQTVASLLWERPLG
jgi:hypothetical protein